MIPTWRSVVAICLGCMVAIPSLGDEPVSDSVPNLLQSAPPLDSKRVRPSSMLTLAGGPMIAVGGGADGRLWIIDTAKQAVQGSYSVDASIDALEPIQDDLFAAISTQSHRTHILRWDHDRIVPLAQFKNSHSPVAAHWDPDSCNLFVACLWSHRIDVLSLKEWIDGTPQLGASSIAGPTASIVDEPSVANADGDLLPNNSLHRSVDRTWDLDFPPRCMTSLRQGRGLVVADAFGDRMSIVDPRSGAETARHKFFGTSIRGLHVENGEMIVLHSMLNEYARTDQNEIHWGVLMANDVRFVQESRMLIEQGEKIYVGGRVNPLGVPGNGSAEPTSMVMRSGDDLAVTIGGNNTIAIGKRDSYTYRYVGVGRYPSALQWSADGKWLFVANRLDDTLSIVDVDGLRVEKTLALRANDPLSIQPPTELERGERLFHSAMLSHDRWMTCASCHVDGHSNGQVTDNFGDRNYGAPKRVPSLLGIAGTEPFTWIGHEADLSNQSLTSIRKTMHSYAKIEEGDLAALSLYLNSLPPPVSVSVARGSIDSTLVERGESLFQRNGCAECHAPPTYTTPTTYDVGIEDEKKQRLFNPPSLRGVSQRGPNYFHDNRAKGLRGVLVDHHHRLESPLSENELVALLAFLESL